MVRKCHRRRFLVGVGASGAIGLSGCVGILDSDDSPRNSSQSDQDVDDSLMDDADDDSEDSDDATLHSGDSIPTYPYGDVDFDPSRAQPDPEADNPVFTHEDVDHDDFEGDTQFVADPFVFIEDGEWHMFMELLELGHGGLIIHAESHDRGLTWEYTGVALKEVWHLANPLVFKWEGEYYMTTHTLPESRPPILYTTNSFPYDWYPAYELYDPQEYDHGVTDHVTFRWNDRWWDLANSGNQDIYIYHSDELQSSGWEPHEDNPVVEDRSFASRPSGRSITLDDRVFIPFQQTEDLYGESIQGYWITELTTESYEDERIGTIIGGTDMYTSDDEPAWNSMRMHHFDPWYLGEGEGWRVAVDGDQVETPGPNWSIGIYHIPE